MKHNRLLLIFFPIFFIGLLLIVSSCSFSSNKDKKEFIRNGMGEGSNTIQLGLLDSKGNLINNGSKLQSKEGFLNYTISIDNFIDYKREYLLLILADFKTVSFNVNNKSVKNYKFTLDPNESHNISTSVKIDKNTKEIIYLIVKNPTGFFKPSEINEEVMRKAASLETPMTLRFVVNPSKQSLSYSKSYSKAKNDPFIESFLSKSPSKLAPLFKGNSKDKAYLSVGNALDKEIDIAVIQFLNWEQVPFNDGNMVDYLKTLPNQRYIKEQIRPHTETESNYQIFVFYKPYLVSNVDYDSQLSFGTYRMVLNP